MPTAIIMDFDGFEGRPTDAYDAVMEDMNLGDVLPAGALRHVAGATESGLRVVDVWEDMDTFGRFAAERIGPITAKHGIGEPVVQSWEVVFEVGADGDPGFLHVVTLPGVDAEAFRALNDLVRQGGGLPSGLLWHANGAVEGGYRTIGAWVSREARDEFIETRIRPALEAAGATAHPQFEDLAVHNSMSTVAAATI
jgi:hypothetical protein